MSSKSSDLLHSFGGIFCTEEYEPILKTIKDDPMYYINQTYEEYMCSDMQIAHDCNRL